MCRHRDSRPASSRSAQGEGARAIFAAEKATVLEGGQTSNPSVGEIVEAIESTNAEEVIVLPNNSNLILAAEEAAKLAAKPARVVPSRSVQAGMAAIVPYLSARSADENEQEMLDALASVVTGEVTIASKDAELDGISIREGGYFGLVDGRAVASGDDLRDRRTRGHRACPRRGIAVCSTSSTGDGAPPVDDLVAALRRDHPLLEVEVHEGGQPHYPLLVVAE